MVFARNGWFVAHADLLRRVKSEAGNYPALYSNLYDAITSKDPGRLAVKPEEAVEVLRLIELGVRSSREGRVLDV